MSKPSLDLWLDVKNLQLYRAISSKYVREVSDVRYGIENNDDKSKCKLEYRSCKQIRRYLIIGLKRYNI